MIGHKQGAMNPMTIVFSKYFSASWVGGPLSTARSRIWGLYAQKIMSVLMVFFVCFLYREQTFCTLGMALGIFVSGVVGGGYLQSWLKTNPVVL